MALGRTLTLLGLAAALVAGFPACKEKGAAEKAGEQIDHTVDKMKDAIDPKGPAEKAGEKIDKAVDNVSDAIDPKGPAEKAGRAIDRATD